MRGIAEALSTGFGRGKIYSAADKIRLASDAAASVEDDVLLRGSIRGVGDQMANREISRAESLPKYCGVLGYVEKIGFCFGWFLDD